MVHPSIMVLCGPMGRGVTVSILYQEQEGQDDSIMDIQQMQLTQHSMMDIQPTQCTVQTDSSQLYRLMEQFIARFMERYQMMAVQNVSKPMTRIKSTEQATMIGGDEKSVRVEVVIEVSGSQCNGEGRQVNTATVWHTVYCTI